VNSNRPTRTDQPPFVPYLERAKRRFPNALIGGSGRYAIAEVAKNGRTLRVFLTDSPDRQKAVEIAKQHGFEHATKTDLGFDVDAWLSKLPDRYPD
jgi:hypothetical protein